MQAYFGSAQASDFNRFGKYYRVVVQADIADRTDPASIDRVFVKNKAGEMVPINTLVKLTRVYGSETASRYNLFNSIEVNAIPKPGYSSGDAIKAIRKQLKSNCHPVLLMSSPAKHVRRFLQADNQLSYLCCVWCLFISCYQHNMKVISCHWR